MGTTIDKAQKQVQRLRDLLGDEMLLEEFIRVMGTDELIDNCECVAENNGIDLD